MMDDEDSWVNWVLQKAAHWAGGELPSWLVGKYTGWFGGNKNFGSAVGDVIDGASAVGSHYEDAKGRDYDETDAWVYGVAEGAIEFARDKVAERLLDMFIKIFKN